MLDKIGDRANTIEKQIKVGTIRLDKSLIQDLSDVERRELLESLEPPARQLSSNVKIHTTKWRSPLALDKGDRMFE